MISIKLQSSRSTRSLDFLSNKRMMMLLNQDEVRMNETSKEPIKKRVTHIHWIDTSPNIPTRSVFNFQRTLTQKEGPQFLEMFGVVNEPETYLEVPESLIKTEAYFDAFDSKTIAVVNFQLTRHLRVI